MLEEGGADAGGMTAAVAALLADEGAAVCRAPPPVCVMLGSTKAAGRIVSPEFMRERLRAAAAAAAAAGAGRGAIFTSSSARVASVLKYVVQDVAAEALGTVLAGLPLLPLQGGGVGVLRAAGGAGGVCYFICKTDAERSLWAPAPSRVIAAGLDTAVLDLLTSGALQRSLNVRTMGTEHVSDLLSAVLPAPAGGASEVEWAPAGAAAGAARAPSLEWVNTLWQYLLSLESLAPLATARHPVLPVVGPAGAALAVLEGARSRVLRDKDMPSGLRAALHGLGARVSI